MIDFPDSNPYPPIEAALPDRARHASTFDLMNADSNTDIAIKPIVCFGSIIILGLVPFLPGDGFFILGYLAFYVPFAVLAMIYGRISAIRASDALPPRHWGTLVIRILFGAAAVLLLFLAFSLMNSINGRGPGGF